MEEPHAALGPIHPTQIRGHTPHLPRPLGAPPLGKQCGTAGVKPPQHGAMCIPLISVAEQGAKWRGTVQQGAKQCGSVRVPLLSAAREEAMWHSVEWQEQSGVA